MTPFRESLAVLSTPVLFALAVGALRAEAWFMAPIGAVCLLLTVELVARARVSQERRRAAFELRRAEHIARLEGEDLAWRSANEIVKELGRKYEDPVTAQRAQAVLDEARRKTRWTN